MKFRVGQSLWYVPASGYAPRSVIIERIGKRWLYCGTDLQIDRETLDAKPNRGFSPPGRAWLSRDDWDRAQRRHGAWRHFRRQVQDRWGPPENVTLEQIQAASDLLRLATFV